jgi:acyl carrier protein
MTDIAARVRKLVAEHLGHEESIVTNDASLVEKLGADSLDLIELAMAAEEEFGFAVGDEQLGEQETVKDIIDLVETQLKAAA